MPTPNSNRPEGESSTINEETKRYKDYVRTILSPSQELAEFASRPIQTCVKCTRSNTTCVKGPLRFRCAPCSNKRRTCSWKEAFVVEFTMKHFGYSQEEAKRLYEDAGRSLKGSGDRDGGPSTKAGEGEADEEGDGDNITTAPPQKNAQSKTAVPPATSASAPVGAARGTEQVVAGKKRTLEENDGEIPSKIQKTGEAGTTSAPDGSYNREPYKKRPYRRHQSQTSVTLRIPVLPASTSAPAAAAANAASPSGSIPNASPPTQLDPTTNYILRPCLEGPFTSKNLNSASTQTTSETGHHVHGHNIGTQTESHGSTTENTGDPVSHHVEALQKRNSSLTLRLEESDKHLKAQITIMQKALFDASTATLRVAILESELSYLKSRLVQKAPLLRDTGTQVDLATGSGYVNEGTLVDDDSPTPEVKEMTKRIQRLEEVNTEGEKRQKEMSACIAELQQRVKTMLNDGSTNYDTCSRRLILALQKEGESSTAIESPFVTKVKEVQLNLANLSRLSDRELRSLRLSTASEVPSTGIGH